MVSKNDVRGVVAGIDSAVERQRLAHWVEDAGAAVPVSLERLESNGIADGAWVRAQEYIALELHRLAQIRGAGAAQQPESAGVPRAILEDRYEGLLMATTRDSRAFRDTTVGEPNRRWLKLVAILDDLIDGVSRSEDDARGNVLDDTLNAIKVAIIDGIEREGIAQPTGVPR